MRTTTKWVLAGVAGLVLSATAARADEYGKWIKDEKKQVYYCEYKYEKKGSTKDEPKYAVQKVQVYYADPDRKNYAYYYNAEDKPWARCAVPGHPKYNASVMYWQRLDGDKYVDYPDAGYCPTPKDGKSPIPNLPLPPK